MLLTAKEMCDDMHTDWNNAGVLLKVLVPTVVQTNPSPLKIYSPGRVVLAAQHNPNPQSGFSAAINYWLSSIPSPAKTIDS